MSTSDPPRGSQPPGSERRGHVRYLACFPAYVEQIQGATHTALIRDLSVTGSLLLTQSEFKLGESVQLRLFITGNMSEYRQAVGHVVRAEPVSRERADLWTWRVAVQFDAPLAQYEAEIRALAERQARLGFAS